MSPKIKHDNPSGWPLVSLLGTKTVLYHNAAAVSFSGAAPDLTHRGELLKLLEYEIARGKSFNAGLLDWKPPDELHAFFTHCRRAGADAGGIRMHGLFGVDVPLEALAQTDKNEELVVLRLTDSQFNGSHIDADPCFPSNSYPKVLVYFNPMEAPPLPWARKDSEEIFELLGSQGESRYIARGLSQFELKEHANWADIIVYFGHGKSIAGFPTVPAIPNWAPFPDKNPANFMNKIIIFAACQERSGSITRFPSGCSIFPVCRIADRKSDFIHDLIESWKSGHNLYAAFRTAMRRDAEKNDIRRFVFYIQGHNRLASQENVFG